MRLQSRSSNASNRARSISPDAKRAKQEPHDSDDNKSDGELEIDVQNDEPTAHAHANGDKSPAHKAHNGGSAHERGLNLAHKKDGRDSPRSTASSGEGRGSTPGTHKKEVPYAVCNPRRIATASLFVSE